jgi:hypothetical protein
MKKIQSKLLSLQSNLIFNIIGYIVILFITVSYMSKTPETTVVNKREKAYVNQYPYSVLNDSSKDSVFTFPTNKN